MVLHYLSIAAAASGLGFVHCSFGCVAPAVAPPVVEVHEAVTDAGVERELLVVARHDGVSDTLRAVEGSPGQYQGTLDFPEGFTLRVSGPGYSDFEDDYDLDDTGGCGTATTTVVVRMASAP